MRVLHLISDTDRRGAQVFAELLHRELRDAHGIDGELLALRAGLGDTSVTAALSPRGIRARRRHFREYDIVVAHGSTTLDAAAISAPGRFVYRSIGDPRFWLDRPRRRFKTRLALSRAAGVVALYEDAAQALHELAGVPRAKLTVIPNAVSVATSGVDPVEIDVPAGTPIVLYVGALSWEKRVPLIIDAVASLGDAHLVVVGGGPLAAEIDTRGSAALGERWHLVGSVDDPTPYYAVADVLALASITEGQPGTLLEAASFGLPIVSADVGGVSAMADALGNIDLVADPTSPEFAAAIGRAVQAPPVTPPRFDPAAATRSVGAAWAECLLRAAGADSSASKA